MITNPVDPTELDLVCVSQISPCPEGLTKREFFVAEIEIFAKRLKARTTLNTILKK